MTEESTRRWEIYALLVDYADAIDNRQFDRIGACFTADASARYSGMDVGPGREAIVAFLDEHLTSLRSTHFVGNVQIDLDGSDRARTDSFMLVTHLVEDDGRVMLRQRGLRYRDTVVLVDGRCQIEHREHIPVWAGEVPGELL